MKRNAPRRRRSDCGQCKGSPLRGVRRRSAPPFWGMGGHRAGAVFAVAFMRTFEGGSMDQRRTAISDSLDRARALLSETGTRAVPFGWDDDADEAAFLESARALLVELGVQLDARSFSGARRFDAAVAEVDAQRERLDSPNPPCECSHPESAHTMNGCWADEPDPAFVGCPCVHRTSWPATQMRVRPRP